VVVRGVKEAADAEEVAGDIDKTTETTIESATTNDNRDIETTNSSSSNTRSLRLGQMDSRSTAGLVLATI
jgi:hypothetical protein